MTIAYNVSRIYNLIYTCFVLTTLISIWIQTNSQKQRAIINFNKYSICHVVSLWSLLEYIGSYIVKVAIYISKNSVRLHWAGYIHLMALYLDFPKTWRQLNRIYHKSMCKEVLSDKLVMTIIIIYSPFVIIWSLSLADYKVWEHI